MNKAKFQNLRATFDNLALVAEHLGYNDRWGQLQLNNGAFVSNVISFFNDNPGALEAVFEWVYDNYEGEFEEEPEDEDDLEADEV